MILQMSYTNDTPYSLGDRLRIKRSDGSSSDAIVKKLMINWIGTVNGRPVIKETKGETLDKNSLGKKQEYDGNTFVATQLYEVTVLNKDGSESPITKVIPSTEVTHIYIRDAAYDESIDSMLKELDEQDASAASAASQDGGKKTKRTKRAKRIKHTKRTKRTKRCK